MELPKSKFVKVRCKCGNEQVLFGSASSIIHCLKCDRELARPTGGKTSIQTKILKVLE